MVLLWGSVPPYDTDVQMCVGHFLCQINEREDLWADYERFHKYT